MTHRDYVLAAIRREQAEKITFWGCLGSQSDIPFGTPVENTAAVFEAFATQSSPGAN